MFDQIYVFSFNRGRFLNNCISSIEKNFQSPQITIIDDCSDDEDTIKYLEELGQRYRIISPHSKEEKSSKYGNLYKNKNWVINESKNLGYKYIMIVSEDGQFVRPFLKSDKKRIKCLFENTENIFQCVPLFIEKVNKFSQFEDKIKTLPDCNFYIKKNNVNYKRLNYTDFGIINVNKFLSLLGKYEESEHLNEQMCIEKGIVCAYDTHPFFALLPFNKYERVNGNKKLIHLINKISQTGFYPYNDMSQSEIDKLFNKPVLEVAYAEDWLTCPNVPNKDLWSFWGGLFVLEVYGDTRRDLAHRLQNIKESNLGEQIKHELMISECERYLEELNNDTSHHKSTSYSYY
jgi:hypothetical protein